MSMERNNWDDEWSGLEPEQRRSNQWGCWLSLIVALILALLICVVGGYLAWQQFDLRLGPGQVLLPPTALSNTPDAVETETVQATATESPSLAPTVTLPAVQGTGAVEAGLLTAAPVVDGDLGEWTDMPAFESSYLVFSGDGWDGTDDVTALWRLGWDNNNLYLAVQVMDDVHVQTQSGNQIFRGDGVSLQIDSNLAADFGSGLSGDDYQVNLSPGDFAGIFPSAFRFRGTSDGTAVDAPGHGIVVAAQQTGEGYQLEATVPWQDIGLTPNPGLAIGLALNVNDNDKPGTARTGDDEVPCRNTNVSRSE